MMECLNILKILWQLIENKKMETCGKKRVFSQFFEEHLNVEKNVFFSQNWFSHFHFCFPLQDMMYLRRPNNIIHMVEDDSFFQLPLPRILNTVKQLDLTQQDDPISFIKRVIIGTIAKHPNEEQTVLLLSSLKTKNINIDLESCIDILSFFTQCEILTQTKQQFDMSVGIDIEYELESRNRLIEKYREETLLSPLFPPLSERPRRFESDIFRAIEHGNLSYIQYCIEQNSNNPQVDVNDFLNFNGETWFYAACKAKQLKIVQYLYFKGADIEKKNFNNMRPIHIACEQGDISIIQFLYFKGADIKAFDKNNWQPIHYACKTGITRIVEFLINKGADIEAQTEWSQMPIHIATENGHLEIVKLLVEMNACIEYGDNQGRKPLHIASYYGYSDIVEYLISKGANISSCTRYGETAYDIAGRYGNADSIETNTIRELITASTINDNQQKTWISWVKQKTTSLFNLKK